MCPGRISGAGALDSGCPACPERRMRRAAAFPLSTQRRSRATNSSFSLLRPSSSSPASLPPTRFFPVLHIPSLPFRKEKSAQPPPRTFSIPTQKGSCHPEPACPACRRQAQAGPCCLRAEDLNPCVLCPSYASPGSLYSSVRTSRPNIVNGISLTFPFGFVFAISSNRRTTATVTSSVLGPLCCSSASAILPR